MRAIHLSDSRLLPGYIGKCVNHATYWNAYDTREVLDSLLWINEVALWQIRGSDNFTQLRVMCCTADIEHHWALRPVRTGKNLNLKFKNSRVSKWKSQRSNGHLGRDLRDSLDTPIWQHFSLKTVNHENQQVGRNQYESGEGARVTTPDKVQCTKDQMTRLFPVWTVTSLATCTSLNVCFLSSQCCH